MGKRLPQLYYVKMKISYDLYFIAIGVAKQRNDAIALFIYLCVSLYQESFLRHRFREYVAPIIASW